MRKIFIILYFFTCVLSVNIVFAEDNFTIKEKKIIEKVNKYFSNLKTLKSNFIQYSDFDGSMAEGIFYISKPNKLRFEYTTPFKNLLITNGKITTFYEMDLDEISNIPTSSTPLSFLLQENQDLKTTNSNILSIKEDENGDFIINTENIQNKNKYFIDYIFDKNIENLKGINFSDDNQQSINLTFFNMSKNIEIDKNLFVFKNPRLYKKRK